MKTHTASPRLQQPDRHQHVLEDVCLDAQLAPDHRVRLVWAFVERLDVSTLEDTIKSRGDQAGAPAIAPRLLLALWLYACLDGVGSARELSRLCQEHVAYRWLCGRVGVNHHTLSDFRAESGAYLDSLLSEIIAALVKAGVVEGSMIFQDGTKVRASAGSSSFRREAAAGVQRIMPLPTNPGGDPAVACQPSDGPGVREWRRRMQTEQSAELLRQRSGVAETPNAELKTYRSLDRLLVRGVTKATNVVLLGVIVYNLMHFAAALVGRPMPPL